MFKKNDPNNTQIDPTAFATFNQQLFHDPTIPPDTFKPLDNPEDNQITAEEIINTTKHHFRANKSSGLSPLPLQILKHFGSNAAAPLAHFLNTSALTSEAPQTWRNTKIIPLYKGKGDTKDMNNYRSIAIPPPFTKLFMAIMNQRLTNHAEDNNIHSPTQAGFRRHHTTLEQALIL
jgi:hypothetical protein